MSTPPDPRLVLERLYAALNRQDLDAFVAERWGGLDTFSLLKQLGVIGAPA